MLSQLTEQERVALENACAWALGIRVSHEAADKSMVQKAIQLALKADQRREFAEDWAYWRQLANRVVDYSEALDESLSPDPAAVELEAELMHLSEELALTKNVIDVFKTHEAYCDEHMTALHKQISHEDKLAFARAMRNAMQPPVLQPSAPSVEEDQLADALCDPQAVNRATEAVMRHDEQQRMAQRGEAHWVQPDDVQARAMVHAYCQAAHLHPDTFMVPTVYQRITELCLGFELHRNLFAYSHGRDISYHARISAEHHYEVVQQRYAHIEIRLCERMGVQRFPSPPSARVGRQADDSDYPMIRARS